LRLTHVRLLVRDFGVSFRFFRDTVGLSPTFGEEAGPYADFETGPATLAIFDASAMDEALGIEPGSGGPGGGDAMVLPMQVDDVDATVGEFESRGVRFVTQPTDQRGWGIRVAHFRDPDGNLIEVYTPLARDAAEMPE
jgi:lactoylglutathione lyase